VSESFKISYDQIECEASASGELFFCCGFILFNSHDKI